MFYIENKTWNKIIAYAQSAYDEFSSEIGGMLIAIEDKDGDWKLQDPIILKQEVSSGNCTLEKNELANYYTRVGKKFKDYNFRFVWWHSHHTMGAFFSATDDKAIKEYSDGDFSLALVVNLKQEYKFRVSIWEPLEIHQDVELSFIRKNKISNSIVKEVTKLCNKRFVSNNYKNKHNGYSYISPEHRQIGIFEYETAFNMAWDRVDELNEMLMLDRIKYSNYKSQIKLLNAQLEKRKTGITITLLPKQNIIDKLMIMSPSELITVDNNADPYALMKIDNKYEKGIPF